MEFFIYVKRSEMKTDSSISIKCLIMNIYFFYVYVENKSFSFLVTNVFYNEINQRKFLTTKHRHS